MRFCCVLSFVLLCLTALTNCGEDSDLAVETVDVRGTVTDKETGKPIEGASANIGGKVALTDRNGLFVLKDVPRWDEMDIVVTATNYRNYKGTVSLDQDLQLLEISLESPLSEILAVMDSICRDIEALDPRKIPSIQSYLSRDYKASRDLVTYVGVWAGVIPPDYDEVPGTVLNIVDKYNRLELKFADPRVEFSGNSASARVRFEVYAETKPPKPQRWEIVVDGRLDLRKQNDHWRITYWKLTSDFLKFEWDPL